MHTLQFMAEDQVNVPLAYFYYSHLFISVNYGSTPLEIKFG